MRFTAVLVALSLALLAASSSATQPDLVMVVHRHGARMPVPVVNASIECPGLPCGALLPEGKDMLRSLGATLRKWYDPILPKQYDPYHIRSRSTSITRTLQSADGFLRGMFPNLTDFYPVIETKPIEDDWLLDTTQAWPANFLHTATTDGAMQVALTKLVGTLFTVDDLNDLAKETNQYMLCPTYATYCVLVGQDVAASLNARGLLTQASYPALIRLWDKMDQVNFLYNQYRFKYDTSSSYDLGAGSQGQLLAQEFVTQANMVLAGTDPTTGGQPYKVIEYSAHDTTLMPLYVTMGQYNATDMQPLFAEAMVFEVFAKDQKNLFIRAFRGIPEQTPGTHPYTFHPYPMQCKNATTGDIYTNAPVRSDSTNLGCPIQDWVEFLALSAPQGAGDGKCFFDPADQEAQCPPVGTAVNATTQAACDFFRKRCPATACPSLFVVNAVNGSSCSMLAP